MDEQALAELIDARRIENLMIHYFERVDALDPFGAVSVFTDDAVGDFMTGKLYEGPTKIARALGRILHQYRHTSHHITNHRALIHGDTAGALTYIYAFHRFPDDSVWHLWARHEDELVRMPDGWRIRRRILRAVDSQPRWPLIDDAWYYGHPGRRTHEELRAELGT